MTYPQAVKQHVNNLVHCKEWHIYNAVVLTIFVILAVTTSITFWPIFWYFFGAVVGIFIWSFLYWRWGYYENL